MLGAERQASGEVHVGLRECAQAAVFLGKKMGRRKREGAEGGEAVNDEEGKLETTPMRLPRK